MNPEVEKENKTLLSKDELSKAINKLTQFLDVDEEEEQDDFPEYLRQKNDQEDYLDEVKQHHFYYKMNKFLISYQ